ncbi:MAG: hypothetical protein ACI3VR_07285 [Intestinibacter sp.]|uniref:hypothetical protein n=1 Tax=Intestinibacter sp. TaxID=1965304 RepID=UPI003F1870DF
MKEPIEYKVDHEWETYDGDRLIAKTVMLSPVHLSKEEEERILKDIKIAFLNLERDYFRTKSLKTKDVI